ncbi:MAG: FeoB-associated Cys-rich membrane protein [Clostridia bacterium]|nr:FeoB-associated Cys-rich membrane protein [Clostridia bacterium]
MFEWLAQNAATIIVAAIVAAVVGLIVAKMIRDKKTGKTSCSCGCGGCPMSESCHSAKK